MYAETHGVQVELEENARNAFVVFKNPCIVCHAVLMGVKRFRPGRDVCGWHNIQEILVCDKC